MEILGHSFIVGNNLGYYAFLSFIFLLILYLLRPKPYKKVIPSLIFLETQKKEASMVSFFMKFVKDYMIFFQIMILLFLCLGVLNITTDMDIKKVDKDVIIVIDASASSQAKYDGKELLDIYKDIAKKKLGITNSIILVKNSPLLLVKETNPFAASGYISSIKATDSLSNIWDAMILAGDVTEAKQGSIIVLSDFADTNGKDIATAKKLLEAKGFKVDLINPKEKPIDNVGIIRFSVENRIATVEMKNFNSEEKEIRIINLDKTIKIRPYSVEQFLVEIKEESNKIEIETKDDFKKDDYINILIPKGMDSDIMYISNRKESYVFSALDSMKNVKIKKAEPPIVPSTNAKLFVLDNVDYSIILPGTIDNIRSQVYSGSSLIIAAQDKLISEKLGDLIPVELGELINQETEIGNPGNIEKLKDVNFGLSTRYYAAALKNNSGIVIANANDKEKSPIIVLSKYGQGNIVYYGIFDSSNQFKLSPQYPLFWINILNTIMSKKDYKDVNLNIGNILYSDQITDPDGVKVDKYIVADKIGIYKIKDSEVSVNLLNMDESDVNKAASITSRSDAPLSEEQKTRQSVNMLPIITMIIILFVLVELFFMKRRGDL
jgi:hypothetical protein